MTEAKKGRGRTRSDNSGGTDGLRWRTMCYQFSQMISMMIFVVLVTSGGLNFLNGLTGLTQAVATDDFSAYQGEHHVSKKLSGQSSTSTRDVRLKVTTVLVAPYVMVAKGIEGNRTKSSSGVVRYEGFIVDLMDAVCSELGLRYQMTPTSDGEYGHQTTDGSWNGMVNQLMNKEVDIAAAALYVTDQREEVVDFSLPFLIVQATLLLKKPPTGTPSRVQSVVDLLKNPDLTYGTLNTGLILRAFRTTNISLYRTIYENVRRFHPPAFTASNEEGIERARRTNYAFILPHTIGDYVSRRFPCDIITVDRFLMKERFALAVPKGSGLLLQLNRAIRVLLENGFIEKLYAKWLLDQSDCNGIQSSKMYSSSNTGNIRTSFHLPLCVLLSVLLVVGKRLRCVSS